MVSDATLTAASLKGASTANPVANIAPTVLSDNQPEAGSTEPAKLSANEDGKEAVEPTQDQANIDPLHYAEQDGTVPSSADDADNEEDYQRGVKQMRAITSVWSKKSLYLTYAIMWTMYFVNAWQSSITNNLGPYIVSGFEAHSLIPVIGIVSSVMSGAAYPPIAKMLNLWDRAFGFAFMTALATIGLILSAVCTNIKTYCAAQVFYSIGIGGMIFSIDVITTDTSSLRDRGLAFAFTSSPYIITAFAGPKGAEGFHDTNWRWGYGTFAIILPIIASILVINLQINKVKARKAGVLVEVSSNRTFVQSFIHYFIEFDAVGIVLLAAGFVLFLLPFSIAQAAKDQWKSPHIIAMLVVGAVLLVAFALFERYFAPRPFLPYNLLISRTVLGACIISAIYQIAYYCWASYFTSFLQVVYNTSVSQAGYISNTFDVVSGVWLLGVGYMIRRTGRFRWILYGAIPIFMLGIGLMIYFRQPGKSVGYIVMCQIFAALGGGAMIICQQVAVLAASTHENAAAALALLNLFGTMGGAVGGSISGAIWTHTFPNALLKYLPEESLEMFDYIYEDLETQLSYPVGDVTRDAIIHAYGDAQTRMLIAGTVIMTLSFSMIFVIRNIKVSEIEQVKGVLF
ncbi:hypothetical protein IAU59_006212 [Kwoniella sp. CBS 9459]